MNFEDFDELLFSFGIASIRDACDFDFEKSTEAAINFGKQHDDDPDFLFYCAECLLPCRAYHGKRHLKTKFILDPSGKCTSTFVSSSLQQKISIRLNFADVFMLYKFVTLYYHQRIISQSTVKKRSKNLARQIIELDYFYSVGKCNLQSMIDIFTAFTCSGFVYENCQGLNFKIDGLEGLMNDGLPAFDAWIQCISKLYLRCSFKISYESIGRLLKPTMLTLRSDTAIFLFSALIKSLTERTCMNSQAPIQVIFTIYISTIM